MESIGRIDRELAKLRDLAEQVRVTLADQVVHYAQLVTTTLRNGGTLFLAGNGGSAADAQHIATEYVIRYKKDRIALPAVALSTDTSLITAGGNDLGFDAIFARQIEALAKPEDLVIFHSTSGNSPNLLRAAEVARAKKVTTAALLAQGGGALAGQVDFAIVLPTDNTSHAQELQLAIEHIVCEYVEHALGLA